MNKTIEPNNIKLQPFPNEKLKIPSQRWHILISFMEAFKIYISRTRDYCSCLAINIFIFSLIRSIYYSILAYDNVTYTLLQKRTWHKFRKQQI